MTLTTTIFDSLLEPVFIVGSDGQVKYCNESFSILCGISRRKITKGRLEDALSFTPAVDFLTNLTEITDATPYKEVNFTTTSGNTGKVQITFQPYGEDCWLAFTRDVTLEETLQNKYRAELNQKESVIADLEAAKLKLEHYSANLESMVAERTQQLSQANRTMAAMMDSLGQGFFIFDQTGLVLDVSSKACEHVLQARPNGKQIWEVLKIRENKIDGFKKWMTTVFGEMLPFEDLVPLAPNLFEHSDGLTVSLEYHAMRSEAGIENIVVVATDITSLVIAQKQAETEKEHAKLIIHMIKSKREIHRFIQESYSIINELKSYTSKDRLNDEGEIFRCLHTLKGGAAIFNIKQLTEECHAGEQLLSELKSSYSAAGFIALRAKSFDIEECFEQFLEETKEILGSGVTSTERHIEIDLKRLNTIAKKIEKIPGGGALAKDLILELAMEPVARFIEPYNEMIGRAAAELDKSVGPLHIHNGTILIVPEVYSPLFSSLVHAFRNSIDHGLETREERIEAGKKVDGQIEVSFKATEQKKNKVLRICIKDDGRGINPVTIREKLTKQGIEHSHLTDFEAIQSVFDSEFSTRDVVTTLSGRGVGMDAIREAAIKLGGKCWVESSLGQGTSIFIEVPYITEIPAAYDVAA